MIVSATQRKEAQRIADSSWLARQFFDVDDREMIANVTIGEFEKEVLSDAVRMDPNRIRREAISQLTVELGLTFILSVIVGWIITKILDYLLETVTNGV